MSLELLTRGETVRFVARGGSMWPFLRDGDEVTLSPQLGRAEVGTIALRVHDDHWVLHRVIARWGPLRCLKGDALRRIDGWFPRSSLVARVQSVHRAGRLVASAGSAGVIYSLGLTALRRLPLLSSLHRPRKP